MFIMLMRYLIVMSYDFIPWIEIILLDGFGIVSFELKLNGCSIVTNEGVCDRFFVEYENIQLFEEMFIFE